ncbi:MAG: CsgG/HfaB family protein [Treponema sp.]|nr:CsgG/HfaB family protein [Treponema sp.]
MKIKKIISSTLIALLGMALFAAGLKPSEGYLKLKWGTSTDDAKKAGYKLSELSASDKEFLKKDFSDGVSAYYVTSKDKTPTSLQFYYYMGRLFQVIETLPESQSSRDKLEKRYGKFSEIGVFDLGEQYACVELTKDGEVQAYWLAIVKDSNGGVTTSFFDWNIFKNVSSFGKSLTGNNGNAGNSFVGKLSDLAEKLVQDGSGKPTYAFLALTSDDGNALVENYVTDALTEAMFNTGKIKIVERASIEKILSEQQFQDSALVNENTASEIGNLTGANYVCYGTVKDLGTQVTLNVKVVEVSTAELCSMGRETVAKDEYLSGVGFEARKTGGIAKKGNTAANAKTVKHVENNLWTVQKFRNDFDGYTQYTFMLKGPNYDYFVVGLRKCDVELNSSTRVGIRWYEEPKLKYGKAGLNYEIKTSDGKIVQMKDNASPDAKRNWNYSESEYIDTSYRLNDSMKWLFDIFLNNDVVSVRAYERVVKFQTAGLQEKIEEAGLSVDEFYKAMSNSEF